MTTYDVCIIGGGAAGIMAAFSARHHYKDASIVVLDHTFELGRKLVISGSGRGNLTNKNVQQSGLFHFMETNSSLNMYFLGMIFLTSYLFLSHAVSGFMRNKKQGKENYFLLSIMQKPYEIF